MSPPLIGSSPSTTPTPTKIQDYPHAALAIAMASTTGATWGTGSHTLSSFGGSTVEPSEAVDEQVDECSSEWGDLDEYTIETDVAPASGHGQEPAEAPATDRAEEQPAASDQPQGQEVFHDALEDLPVDEEVEPVLTRPRRRRRGPRRDPLGMARFTCMILLPALCAMAAAEDSDHWEDLDRETLQQLAGPEAGKSVIAPSVIRQAVGKDLDGWILAAQAEHASFLEKEAVVEATVDDLRAYGRRLLPMLNVWSKTSEDVRKCRSCIAGNFQKFDPAAQRWTAQAEPGSIFAAAKLAALRGWRRCGRLVCH